MKKIKIKNYKRFICSIIILILILLLSVKLCTSIFNHKKTNNNEIVTSQSIGESTNVEQAKSTNLQKTEEEKKYKRQTSRAIPLAEGEKSDNSLAVLMYHYFFDDTNDEIAPNSNYMSTSSFEEQLKFLKDNDYYYPTWDEVADFVDGKIDLPEKSVVITMDDGDSSVFELALPLLEKYEIPATAFIITGSIDGEYLKKYSNSILDLQSHTDDMHREGGNIGHGGIFTALSLEESTNDLKKSIEKLGGNSGALAYPYGDCTEKTKEAVKNAGFKVAFTTVNEKIKPGMDKYELPRVRMFTDITLYGFEYSIK